MSIKFWKNTTTLDALVPDLKSTVKPEFAELAVIGNKPIDVIAMPNLKGIFKCGVGTDNVPFDAAEVRDIKICLPSEETRRYIYEETANFAVYLVYRMLYSEVGELGSWKKYARGFLGKKKVLVLGQGNIGSYVKHKLKLSVDVLTFDVLQNSMGELEAMVEAADVVSLHIPLTDSTRGFIDAEKLSWIKDGAAVVNTARGSIVDEDALYHEISNGRLKAAFDVFWHEPYTGGLRAFHPDRFLMSPHISSNCEDFLIGLSEDLNQFAKCLEL